MIHNPGAIIWLIGNDIQLWFQFFAIFSKIKKKMKQQNFKLRFLYYFDCFDKISWSWLFLVSITVLSNYNEVKLKHVEEID